MHFKGTKEEVTEALKTGPTYDAYSAKLMDYVREAIEGVEVGEGQHVFVAIDSTDVAANSRGSSAHVIVNAVDKVTGVGGVRIADAGKPSLSLVPSTVDDTADVKG